MEPAGILAGSVNSTGPPAWKSISVGTRLSEVEWCWRSWALCWCASITPMATRTKFVLLMHPKEFKEEKAGTGRLTHLCLPNSELHMGKGFDGHEAVQALIKGEVDFVEGITALEVKSLQSQAGVTAHNGNSPGFDEIAFNAGSVSKATGGHPIGNPNPAALRDNFPSQNPVLMAILWSFAIMAVCIPFARARLKARTVD